MRNLVLSAALFRAPTATFAAKKTEGGLAAHAFAAKKAEGDLAAHATLGSGLLQDLVRGSSGINGTLLLGTSPDPNA